MIRFAVYPGWITSPNDGDSHYIGFMALCDLHGVDPREAIDMSRGRGRSVNSDRLLALRPFPHGGGYWHVSETERSCYPVESTARKSSVT